MRNLLPFLLLVFSIQPVLAQQESALARTQRLPPMEMDEVLWLARAVYSESDRADEQELVAWVIRNRVETGFRGTSYREVVLEPRQFSAFNAPSERRDYILGLDHQDVVPSWIQALDVSLNVYQARPTDRPFAIDTRHFYSPVSMVGRSEPAWASAGTPLSSFQLGVDPERFRFFSGVDQAADEVLATIAGNATDRETAAIRIEDQRIEQQTRAAERSTTLQRSSRVRKFSGKVSRPARPRRGANN